MTTKHTVTLTCDICKVESHSDYSWARITISGSTGNLILSRNQHHDLCPDCWKPIRQLIYPRKAATQTTE